jgi:hypothetical protein
MLFNVEGSGASFSNRGGTVKYSRPPPPAFLE